MDRQLDELVLLALVWGEPDVWRPTVAVRETVGRFPAGLGPSLGPARRRRRGATDRGTRRRRPPEVREVVDALTWTNPTGRVKNADRVVTPESAATPVEWLLARGVLRPLDKGTVVLPREVALHLRAGRLHRDVATEPPPAELHHHDPVVVDRLATGTADELVRRVTTLLERWAVSPPGVLRSGGLGIRDLRAAASLLDVDEQLAALVVDVTWASGLLATSGETDDEWLPTPAYDLWRTRSVAERWAQLAEAWLSTARVASLVGTVGNWRLAGERPDPGRRTHRRSRHPPLGAAGPRVVRRGDGSQRRLARPPA